MCAVTLSVDGQSVTVPENATVLQAAQSVGINIPTLCYLKDYTKGGACRMCMVEVKGAKGPMPACNTKVKEGMEVQTDTAQIRAVRRKNLELIASNHRMDCTYCARFPYCELNALCREYGLDDRTYRYSRPKEMDDSACHLTRDHSKCILCGRCVAACEKQAIRAIGVYRKGRDSRVTPGAAQSLTLDQTRCIRCGQCVLACPVGALREKNDTQPVFNELHHHEKAVWVGLTPAVAAELGECMREEIGTPCLGKTVAILRKLGFEKVLPISTAAEAAAREQKREASGRDKPLISSACPAVAGYIRKNFPDLQPLLSKAENPVARFGTLCKTTYAKAAGVNAKDLFVVAITSCMADKGAGYENVDATLTVRELSIMIRRACVSDFTAMQVWNGLESSAYDSFEGAQPVCAQSGGIAETCETTGMRRIAASGMDHVIAVLEKVRKGELDADRLELLACPGGCLNGGGAPRVFAGERAKGDYLAKRQSAVLSDKIPDKAGC